MNNEKAIQDIARRFGTTSTPQPLAPWAKRWIKKLEKEQ